MPPRRAVGDVSCTTQVSASWSDVTATSGGVVLNEAVTGLTTDTLYRWRARVLHAPFTITEAGITPPPNPAHGPWRRVSAQAEEVDIRLLPESGAIVSLVSGMVLLSWLYRRRRSPM